MTADAARHGGHAYATCTQLGPALLVRRTPLVTVLEV